MDSYNKAIIKYLLFFCFIGLCGRFIHEGILILVAFYGLSCALRGKRGMVMACFIFLPLAIMLNPGLIARTGELVLCAKIGMLIMIIGMIFLGAKQKGRHRLLLTHLYLYLIVSIISSIDGWFPVISFLKIVQFALFICALQCAVRAMQDSYETLSDVRAVMMALSIIVIIGSLLVLPFPNIAYSMMITKAARWGVYLTGESIVESEGMRLFNGVCYHSQALAPIAAMFAAWVFCDMLFVEHRMRLLHMVLLVLSPVVLYLTRSRTAMVALFVLVVVVHFYAINFIPTKGRIKQNVKAMLYGILIVTLCAGVFMEIKNGAISKWIRKTDETSMDERTVIDAFTESRMGLVERNMYDFSLNPFLGKGFQVVMEHPQLYREGRISLISAPIEKGVLPTMVLGETGVVGMMVFICFLFNFTVHCSSRGYMALLSLFAVLFASNLGEASFFSPSGQGGVMWIVVAIGGLCCDLIAQMRQIVPYEWQSFSPPNANWHV